MNINDIFDKFLKNEVDLNPNRYEKIEKAEEALTEFIKTHPDFKDLYIDYKPQGSYRQKTIIKPADDGQEFDVDLLIQLKENQNWDPKTYLLKLGDAFKESGRYEDITDTKGKTRCVTINYKADKGDFHVDLVPTINKGGKDYIFNKKDNDTEITDGNGYGQWFEEKNSMANGNLIPVVKLIKYLRDSKKEFKTKSIIITTLAGMVVSMEGNYSNLPEALAATLSGLKGLLDSKSEPFKVKNPAMPEEESFDRDWLDNTEEFKKFKKSIDDYASISNIALGLLEKGDEPGAIKEYEKLFGDKFGFIEDKDGSTGSPGSVSIPRRPSVPGPQTPPLPPRRREVG